MWLRIDRPSLLRASVLVLGGAALGLAANAMRPDRVSLFGFEAPVTCSAGTETQAAPIVEMAPHEASHLCGRPGVVFADTRPAARFAEGHVADAVHLPCDASAVGAEPALKKLDKATTIIVYGDSSDDGHSVAETLRKRGLNRDLRVLRGGFAAWEKEGLACASGPCRDCTAASSKEAP
ncbi:MAG: rhodanese-like domain-containing protein [Minicystis sp.]